MGWVDLGRLGHTVILQTVVYTVNNYLHTVAYEWLHHYSLLPYDIKFIYIPMLC